MRGVLTRSAGQATVWTCMRMVGAPVHVDLL